MRYRYVPLWLTSFACAKTPAHAYKRTQVLEHDSSHAERALGVQERVVGLEQLSARAERRAVGGLGHGAQLLDGEVRHGHDDERDGHDDAPDDRRERERDADGRAAAVCE